MNDIMDAKVFGVDHRKCKYTGLPLESGSGARSDEEQAAGNLGKLEFSLAELTQRRKDLADTLASEQANLSTMHVAHVSLRADDVAGRQNSLYALARQDTLIASLKRQSAALATEHEAAAVKIGEVKAMFKEENIGEGPANVWRSQILQRGWSLP